MHTPPFASWDTAIFNNGWNLGVTHATTGDPQDFSDLRCAPLERERDTRAAEYGAFGSKTRAAFLGGYEAGYSSVIGSERF